jgi:hypothetical protein
MFVQTDDAALDLLRLLSIAPHHTTARLKQGDYTYAVALSRLIAQRFVRVQGQVYDEATFFITDAGRRWLKAQGG